MKWDKAGKRAECLRANGRSFDGGTRRKLGNWKPKSLQMARRKLKIGGKRVAPLFLKAREQARKDVPRGRERKRRGVEAHA